MKTRLYSKAVNVPLQQRGIVLDSDLSNANAFPAHYETDLDYAWAHPSRIFLSSIKTISLIVIFA